MFSYDDKDYFKLYNYFNSKTEYELIVLIDLKSARRNRIENFMLLLGGLIVLVFELLFDIKSSAIWFSYMPFIAVIIVFISFLFMIKRLEWLDLEISVISRVLAEKRKS